MPKDVTKDSNPADASALLQALYVYLKTEKLQESGSCGIMIETTDGHSITFHSPEMGTLPVVGDWKGITIVTSEPSEKA